MSVCFKENICRRRNNVQLWKLLVPVALSGRTCFFYSNKKKECFVIIKYIK